RVPPTNTPASRSALYHLSTGCSLTKPWPPSSCTPSEPIFIPFWAQSRRAMAASRPKSSPWSARPPPPPGCTAPAGDGVIRAEVLTVVGAARRPVGRQPHAVRLDPDFGDREGDALAVGD